ncbi:ribosomal-protein-alanine N-acetyltransferase [Lachnospiraceae bacterium XBB1006]|nr:ribosomal-protein-alanine N-acetyltransferase [Lachnospiraceae bacterium XBB1006]
MIAKREERFRKFYTTDRLYLKILDESDAPAVLAFLNAGANTFDTYESKKPADFYTTTTQRRLLHAEFHMASQKSGVRFWICRKDTPKEIIGTISFSFYKTAPFQTIMVGYKLLPDYWHQGYASEALTAAIHIVPSVMHVARIEAYVLPENRASQTLLSRVGFRLEGTAYQCLEVQGVRRDHLLYSYIVPSI